MTDADFTRHLERQLGRELDGVALPARLPAQARYQGLVDPLRGRTLRRAAGVIGALALAGVTSVVVASAAPGITPPWAAEAHRLVTHFVSAPPAPAPGPTEQDKPGSQAEPPSPAPPEPIRVDAAQPGQQVPQLPTQERDVDSTKDTPSRLEDGSRESNDESHENERKEKTSDFPSDRGSSARP